METSEGNSSLVTIRETFGRGNRYLIPDYQRGYKWTVAEVRKLLEDVADFRKQAGRDYYCLQNLTLVRSGDDPHLIKVVDGQQRLTTSTIIISYLRTICPIEDVDICLNFGDRKKNTTQRFLEEKILNGQLWRDVADIKDKKELDIVKNEIWLNPHPKKLAEELHKVFGCSELKEKFGVLDYDHSDIFHLFCAAMTVAAYLRKVSEAEVGNFAEKFLREVRFLHNIIDDPSSQSVILTGESLIEAEIFSKINGFRVPLDGADLLRAIFITNVARESAPAGEIEREVWLNEVRIKIGLELDQMNAWWHESRHQRYFKILDKVVDPASSFDAMRYPINHLYRLFVASKGESCIYLDRFERPIEGSVAKLYSEVLQFHAEMKDWFEDVPFYHLAGFLAGQCGVEFKTLYNLRRSARNRRNLVSELKRRIFFCITMTGDESFGDYGKFNWNDSKLVNDRFENMAKAIDGRTPHDWYAEEIYSVKQLLVLMDVIAFTDPQIAIVTGEGRDRSNKTKMRTPLADHLDPEFFKCKDDDKEHIFPQTPIGSEVLKKLEFLKVKVGAYWNLIVDTAGESRPRDDGEKQTRTETLMKEWGEFWSEQEKKVKLSDEPFPIDAIGEKWFKWLLHDPANFEQTKVRLNQFVFKKCRIDINSIGNIVMLDFGINRERSYSNSHYTEKRTRILECYRRQQPVRLHTYRVFVKEFSDKSSLDVWGKDSIVANRESIRDDIHKYFSDLLDTEEPKK